MGDLMHWHKPDDQPSVFTVPPECCQLGFRTILHRETDRAVHEERRRVVLDTLAEVERYANALASVLTGEHATLATKVINHVVDRIQQAGCICPMIDVSTLGEPPGSRLIAGGDKRCGVHGGRTDG